MSTLLQNVIEGSERPSSLLIVDSVQTSGQALLKSILTSRIPKETAIVLLLEQPKNKFVHGLKKELLNSLVVLDRSVDPFGWDDASSTHNQCTTSLYAMLTPVLRPGGCTVLVDSLSTLLIGTSVSDVCRQLQQLSNTDIHVISMVHRDLHSDHDLELLKHRTSCVLHLDSSVLEDCPLSCQILLKRPNGKVIRQTQAFNTSSQHELVTVRDVGNVIPKIGNGVKVQNDPTANLTFNLKLSDREKDDKRKLIAPYIKNRYEQESILQKSVGEAKVFYQPDEVDDFDDEDPDEDLVI